MSSMTIGLPNSTNTAAFVFIQPIIYDGRQCSYYCLAMGGLDVANRDLSRRSALRLIGLSAGAALLAACNAAAPQTPAPTVAPQAPPTSVKPAPTLAAAPTPAAAQPKPTAVVAAAPTPAGAAAGQPRRGGVAQYSIQ